MLLLCTLVYITLAMIDVIPIVKHKKWKVLVVYSVVIITAYVFSVLTESGVTVPSPAGPIKNFITSIVGTS